MVEISMSSSWVRTGSIELTMLPSSGPTKAPTATPANAVYAPNRGTRVRDGAVSAVRGCWASSIIAGTDPEQVRFVSQGSAYHRCESIESDSRHAPRHHSPRTQHLRQ